MTTHIKQCALVPSSLAGKRLDQVAVELFPDFSRSRIQSWIKEGLLCVDGSVCKPKHKLAGAERLELDAPLTSNEVWVPEAIALDVVFEDEHILVINKHDGLVVHPGAGNWSGTLLNGLLHRVPSLAEIPRAGIVHRLDKHTTGLMVVAKTLQAQCDLVDQLQARSVSRQYLAVCDGPVPESGFIDKPLGRHSQVRTKMAVVSSGKPARTHYRRVESVGDYSLVELKLETGRTHQIRVHMADLGCPCVGDPVYGRRGKRDIAAVSNFSRQALHARRLGLQHPATGQYCEWEADLPSDMQELVEQLSLYSSCQKTKAER